MAASDSVDAAWALVDTATNELKARVQKWIDEVNKTATDGLNGPQTENLLLKLGGLATALGAIGKNPDAPIPPVPPEPPPMPGPFA